MNKKKIFLVYLKTGGGHLAPARAIANYLKKHYPDEYESILVNGLEEAGKIVQYSIEDGYRILQAQSKWYYEFLYLTNKFSPIAYWNRWLLSNFMMKYLEKRILSEKPDKIVIFHFFCYDPVYRILAKHNLSIPVITVVTDPFTAHPLWFLKKDQNFILFSERLKNHVAGIGIPNENLHVFPFILDEKFSQPMTPQACDFAKRKLKIDSSFETLLILGGGDGIPKGYEILNELIRSGFEGNIAIVCGRNTTLRKRCIELADSSGKHNIYVFGYIDFVYELLNIAKVVITKCGASTFMEIIQMGKIPVIIDYLWEQEKGNVEFLTDNGMGIYEPSIRKLPALVNRLFEDKEYYQSFIENIIKGKPENGCTAVAEFIRNF